MLQAINRLGEKIDGVSSSLGERIDDLGEKIDDLGERIDDLDARMIWVNAPTAGVATAAALSELALYVWGGLHEFKPAMQPGATLDCSCAGFVFMSVWTLIFFALSRYLGDMRVFKPTPYPRLYGSSGISKTTSLIYIILRILHGAFEGLKTVVVREAAPGAIGATSGISVYHRCDGGFVFIGSASLYDVFTRGGLPFTIHGFKTHLKDASMCVPATLTVAWGDSVLLIGDAPSQALLRPWCWVLAAHSVGSLFQPQLACEVPLRLWLPSREEVFAAMKHAGVEEEDREERFALVGANLALACGKLTLSELSAKVDETVSRLLEARGAVETPHTLEVGTRYNYEDELGGQVVRVWGSTVVVERFTTASERLARVAVSQFFAAWNDPVVNGLLHQEEYLQVLRNTLKVSGRPRFVERVRSSVHFKWVERETQALEEVRDEMMAKFGRCKDFSERAQIRDGDWEPAVGVMYLCGGNFPVVDAFLRTKRLLIGVNATVVRGSHRTSWAWLIAFLKLSKRLKVTFVLFFVTNSAFGVPVTPGGIPANGWDYLEETYKLLFAQADVDSSQAFKVPRNGKADAGFAKAVRTIVGASGSGRTGRSDYKWCREFEEFEFTARSREVPFPFALDAVQDGSNVVFSPALEYPAAGRTPFRFGTGLTVNPRGEVEDGVWQIVDEAGLRSYDWHATEVLVDDDGQLWVEAERLKPRTRHRRWVGFEAGLVQISHAPPPDGA